MGRRRNGAEIRRDDPASKDLYRAFFDQAANGVVVADEEGRLVDVNRRGCEMLDYPLEELRVLSLKELIRACGRSDDPLPLDQLKAEKALLTECSLQRKDGTLLPVELSAWMLPDGTGFLGMLRDVSDRRRARRDLENSREPLRASEELQRVMACVSDYLWSAEVDQEGNWSHRYYSPVVEKIAGRPPAFYLETPDAWLETVHPDDRPRVLDAFRRLAGRESELEEDEYRIVHADGTIRWVRDSAKVTPLGSGRLRVDGVVSDITQRKHAEDAHQAHLRFLQSMDRINRALQGTNDLEEMTGNVLDVVLSIFDCDRAWLCYPFERRPSWLSLIERTRPEYPGGPALGVGELMIPEDVKVFEGIRAAGGPVKYGPQGDRPLRPEVTERYGMQSQIVMAIYPNIGEPWIFGLHQCSYPRAWMPEEERLFREIGPRLADVLTSLLVNRNLRQSERKLKEAERMAHVGWWERDYDANRITLSSEACRILGLPSDERQYDLDDWQERWQALMHPEDRAETVETVEGFLRGGSGYDVEYRVIRPDGELRFVRSQADVTWDESGQLRRVFGIMQDITKRKELEAANERLAAQFFQAQKMESIGRLAGGIAHDFNNLLVPIIGYIDLNLEDLPRESRLYGDLVQVRKAAERAADLTRQILAFSRQQVLQLSVLDLNDVVESFKKMLQRLIGEDIELQTFLSPSLYPVEADRGQVEQVLMNLVINSRDAMPTGGRLSIETGNTFLDATYVERYAAGLASGNYVMLAVSDTGQGMDAQTREHIFDPFYTTKESGKGTGLGLATVFGIIKQHRGHIGVYSEPGQGTTLKIYLPRARDTDQSAIPLNREPISVHGTETVLVVEDEEMVRQLVCETLRAHGYDVVEAKSGAECLELASRMETVHLLLTDVIMPEMNGQELGEQLTVVQPNCKVLYMSGYTHNVIVHHSIPDEGVNFLQKPFTIRDLMRKVREVLG